MPFVGIRYVCVHRYMYDNLTKLQNNNKTIGTRQIGEVERHNEQNIDEEKKTKMAASSTLFAILPISIV